MVILLLVNYYLLDNQCLTDKIEHDDCKTFDSENIKTEVKLELNIKKESSEAIEQTKNIHPLKNTDEKQNKISLKSAKNSKFPTETGSQINKTKIKMELKQEAPDYINQSVWSSVKVPEENFISPVMKTEIKIEIYIM